MLVRLGKRAWLHCDDCRHSIMIEPRELAQRHRKRSEKRDEQKKSPVTNGGCRRA